MKADIRISENSEQNLIEIKNVSIEFPGVKALQEINCSFESGQVKALVGANGAGKSTLMKILAGANPTYTGDILYNHEKVEIRDPRSAKMLGIGIVYQEVDSILAPNLSVAENIMIDEIVYGTKGIGIMNWKKINAEAEKILKELGIEIDVKSLVSNLTLAQKQMVVIAQTMVKKCSFLILDEPTAPLSIKETQMLFQIVRRLKNAGCGIIFISHRLNELFEICDDISVMKDGRMVGSLLITEAVKISDIVQMMLGNTFKEKLDKSGRVLGETILKTHNFSDREGRVQNIDLEIKRGEIVGISGLVGAGKTELCKALFGEYGRIHGTYEIHGRKVVPSCPRDAIREGIALIPEERRKEGIFLEESVNHNLSVVTIDKYTLMGFVLRKNEKRKAKKKITDLLIKTPTENQKVGLLSGGNQQKVTIGKWLDSNADIYIFDEPTKGIDVGAKQEIYKLIVELAREGKGIVYTSSEQSEILLLSDRVYVMYDGFIQKELRTEDTNEEEILFYSTGGGR